MNDLDAHLDDLGASAPVRRLATNVAARTAVESSRDAHYVSLRPAMHGAIALYLFRHKAGITLPRDGAAAQLPRFPGAWLRVKSRTTTSLMLPDDVLVAHSAAAADLAEDALLAATTRRSSRRTGTTGHSHRTDGQPVICPKHWTPLLPSGACADCD